MIDQTTADKILTDMFESGWFHQDQIDYFEKEIINSLVSEPPPIYNVRGMCEPVEDELVDWMVKNGGWRREDPEGGKFDNPVYWYIKVADVIGYLQGEPPQAGDK